MSYILSIYSQDAFKEYILPAVNNTDYELLLPKEFYHLNKDITVYLEVLDEQWYFKPESTYTIFLANRIYQHEKIKDADIFQIYFKENDTVSVIAKEVESCFHVLKKYSLKHVERISIGKDKGNDILYDYLGLVSRSHAKIEKNSTGCKITNVGQNGTYVNAERIMGEKQLRFGDYINILGLHMVYLGDVLAIDIDNQFVMLQKQIPVYHEAETETVILSDHASDGRILYHRSPRSFEKIEQKEIEIEAPPPLNKTKEQPLFLTVGPSITMALPMLMGCMLMIYASSANSGGRTSLYMYSGLIMSLSSAVIGVSWTLANMRYRKKEEKAQEEYRLEQYSRYLLEKTEEVKEAYTRTEQQLHTIYSAASECLHYNASSVRLWNRNRTHEDFLNHRLGLGKLEYPVKLNVPKRKFELYADELSEKPQFVKDNYSYLYHVPVTLNLLKKKLLGIIGGPWKSGAVHVVKLLAAQVAANNCYTDVKLMFLHKDKSTVNKSTWEFAKWLPHVWSGDRKIRYMASTQEEVSEIFYELTQICRMRTEEQQEGIWFKPYYLIFIDDVSMLEGEPFAKYVFDGSLDCGMTVVLLAERYEELPNACEFIIENTNEFRGMYDLNMDRAKRQEIQFDAIESKELDLFSRKLASIRVLELEEGGEIPDSLSFFDMYGISRPEELPIRELWAKNRVYENIRGIIGQKAGGVPCFLDVHEKYHGPHGLVAGTTGSGKSETLQTYILSLAVNYSPDDIAFFIIDYKGGGMANLFHGLPHMIGAISNLSGNQVHRAMISIKSENRRRQKVFMENDVNNINAYTKKYKNGEASAPVPHLFIIIDEFAELKREEPEFMKELISVAQVGRSLGVHLILATQKPSGTVDDNIWSNSKFRLCLRVQDQQDSRDMLHKPDAAYITQAGRCYLQVGNDEVYELFQSGFSGAVYEEQALGQKEVAALLTTTGRIEQSSSSLKLYRRKQDGENSNQRKQKNERTQLDVIIDLLAQEAERNGYVHDIQLWMPLLPQEIYLENLGDFEKDYKENWTRIKKKGDWELDICIGKADDPHNQAQLPFAVDFAKNGHVAVLGGIVCGKSTVLQTVAFALIHKYSPEEVNLYALDFSGKMMGAFEHAPHTGGIMYEEDLDKISKFFNMLNVMVQERKHLFKGGNYRQYVQVKGPEIPAIVLFIDNYAAFKEKTKEAYEEQMIQLSKEGVNLGIYLVISGSEYSMADITRRVGENLNTVLCLSMQDKFAYGEYLHTMQLEVLPEAGVKGRGLAWHGDRVLEYQTALALSAENDYDRMEQISSICKQMRQNWQGNCARAVPQIPEKPVWSEFSRQEEVVAMQRNRQLVPVGYDTSSAQIYGMPLNEIYCYLICGGARTGKTNFLKIVIQSVLQKEARVLLIDSPDKNLVSYRERDSVSYADDEQSIFDMFKTLSPVFAVRNKEKHRLQDQGLEEDEIFDTMSRKLPYFVFIADLAWFISLIYSTQLDMKGFMETIITKGSLHNIYIIAELDVKKRTELMGYPLYEAFTSYKKGIHFGGRVSENTVLSFEHIPYVEQGKSRKPGVGLLSDLQDANGTTEIVIPISRR